MRDPSGLMATEKVPPLCINVIISSPVCASHTLIFPSISHDTRRLPSGLNTTHQTSPSCPSRVMITSPVNAFRSLIVFSSFPSSQYSETHEAMCLSSGLKAAYTYPACPRKLISSAPVTASQTVPFLIWQEKMRFPSGLNCVSATISPLGPWSVISSATFDRSHTVTLPLPSPDTMRLPSGLKATTVLLSVTCTYLRSIAKSHTLIVLSKLPETMRFPSGLNSTDRTASLCPGKVITSAPVTPSHSLTVSSPPDETIRFPSGLTATPNTLPVCPWRIISSPPVAASHNRIVLSLLPDTMRLLSGLIA